MIFKKKTLYFVPLGGSNEIGMNLNVYGYNDQWVVVDLGITFGHKLGIEVIVPDINFLRDKNVLAVVATHGHEDHIGAIPYLWPELKCPIYATPFTASLIQRKLHDVGHSHAPLYKIPLKGSFEVGPFSFQYITLTHSIPEPNALVIRTPAGTIFHTGDWKIDPAPLLGELTDEASLKALGDEGVLALVGDSTNAMEEGWSGSEKTVREELIALASSIKQGTIAITCFASNVARLETCILAAQACNRKPVLVGRSLHKMYESARQCGYLEGTPRVYNERELKTLDPKKVLLICTGSQGEAKAALSRMASGQHPTVRLASGDTVIFSSRVIPGNEKEIAHVYNQLVRKGITLLTARHAEIHVSGHPYRDELRQMYQWIRPQIAIPVHGEPRHLQAHGLLAQTMDVPFVHIPENGMITTLSTKGVTVEGHIETTPAAVDGSCLIPLTHEVFGQRQKLMQTGVIFVSLSLGQSGQLEEVELNTLGIFLSSDEAMDDLSQSIEVAYEELILQVGEPVYEQIHAHISTNIRRKVEQLTGKKPMCVVHLNGL